MLAAFKVASAKDIPGQDFDLVTRFDCLHDMGDLAAVPHAFGVAEAGRHTDEPRADTRRSA
jgi:hypothetical protein